MGNNRLIGIYLAVVGVGVAAQFTLYPLYGNSSDVGLDIWMVLDWLMAVGLVLMLLTTHRRRRNEESSIAANAMFFGAAILALAYFPNWFGEAFGEHPNVDTAWTIWHLIDSVLPVLFITEGRRLLKTS